jgi:hypothetical protein
MKATLTTLLAASVLISSVSAVTAGHRRPVYGYVPYAYVPPPWNPYGTYAGGFSPFPYSDGFGGYARSSFGFVPRGDGFYGYAPDPDSSSGYGPVFGSNPWWRAMGRFGMDGRPQ